MNIFCDTNIIMEILQQRKFAAEVNLILTDAIGKGYGLFISLGSFYTVTYLVERYLKEDKTLSKEERLSRLRYILNGVLDTFKLAGQLPDSIIEGVNDERFDDLEDSYQAHAAEEMGCGVLLTVNEKHFARFNAFSSVQVLTPQQYLEQHISD